MTYKHIELGDDGKSYRDIRKKKLKIISCVDTSDGKISSHELGHELASNGVEFLKRY